MAEPKRSDVAHVDNYEVFINFRGPDARESFVKPLYEDLVAKGIRVFRDDDELTHGKRLDKELEEAINNSKIYVVVISKTYAASKWCLKELVWIVRNMQQFKEKKEILPVFYEISTEDVKLKTVLFNEQLDTHKKKVEAETIEEWATALKGIPELKAWKVPGDGSAELVCSAIAKRVSIIQRVRHKPVPENLIGIDDSVVKVMELLDIESPGLQIVGIHGMGGIGKTTLASAVYNNLCEDEFERCCFVHNVRESLDKEKGNRGCLELQKNLLQEVSNRGDVNAIRNVQDAVRKIQLTLQGKKVLMVFDDVSEPDQIERLIGGTYTTLGRASRIIITTRDKRVLGNGEFTKIHQMDIMEDEHALTLFSLHAFGKPVPSEEYSSLSNDVVSLTGKLPLALQIIGSLFHTESRNNWNQIVKMLRKRPNEKIQETLMISYESLSKQAKEIFLDIACFFVDKGMSHEDDMWKSCDLIPKLGIDELISKCLIKIEDDGEYWMHDHIKALGREIVSQEDPENNEPPSRIWKKQYAIDVLTNGKKENNKINGILLENLEHTDGEDGIWTLRKENCVNLNRLRFLQLDTELPGFTEPVNVQLEGSFEQLLPNLRWLSLQCMKMERFKATKFNLKNLVILNLSYSDITESWAGWKEMKDLPCLQVLNLSYCLGLKKTPDLFHYASLKSLILNECENLEEIDDSVIYLKALKYLYMENCVSLKELPDYIFTHVQLEDYSSGGLTNLKHLDLTGCIKLIQIPNSIGRLVKLEHLSLNGCRSLDSLPNSITNLRKLGHLDLSDCKELRNLPDSIGELVELEVLLLDSCEGLVSLPNSLTNLPKLQTLVVSFCKSLESLPDSVGEMVQLKLICIDGLELKKLPCFISSQKELELLEASQIELPGVPTGIEELPCLRELNFSWSSICGLPSLVQLSRLEKLNLSNCNHLEQLPELPTSLVKLYVSSNSLQSIPDYSCLTNLTELELDLVEWEEFGSPNEDGKGVQTVLIDQMSEQLPLLNVDWIWRLSKLKKLQLSMTSFTTTIPSESVSLSRLEKLIFRCSVLGTCVTPFLSKLRRLNISLYRGTTSLSLPRLNRLTNFILSNSRDLAQIFGLGELESLIYLKIESCNSLDRVDDISKLRKLSTLEICNCEKLRVICGVPGLQSLTELKIDGCESLESLVGPYESSGPSFNSRRILLDRLTLLEIEDCPKLMHLPGLEALVSLQKLSVINGGLLLQRLSDFSKLLMLEEICMFDCETPAEITGLRELDMLRVVKIKYCDSLERLDIDGLKRLQHLSIRHCCNLQHIGTRLDDLPTSIVDLEIVRCPLNLKLAKGFNIRRGRYLEKFLDKNEPRITAAHNSRKMKRYRRSWRKVVSFICLVVMLGCGVRLLCWSRAPLITRCMGVISIVTVWGLYISNNSGPPRRHEFSDVKEQFLERLMSIKAKLKALITHHRQSDTHPSPTTLDEEESAPQIISDE